MIDRYSIAAPKAKIHERFHSEVLDNYVPNYNASPTQLLPVIMHTSPQGLSTFYWGNVPKWSKNKALSEKIINIHAETIPEKSAWRRGLMKYRCLIPADGFYAWKKVGKKTIVPYRFVLTDTDLFSFAGIWEEFEDEDGTELHTFSIITTPANELVSSVQERMPAILTSAAEKIWMDKDSGESALLNVLIPYPADKMNYYPVSPRILDSSVNVPSLIIPTPPADQFGNLTLFD
jgi:putative SOS response-associated peptidase YedK